MTARYSDLAAVPLRRTLAPVPTRWADELAAPVALIRASSTKEVIELRGHDNALDLADLYDTHGNALFGFALNSLSDRGEAEEVVQDTFVRAWRARHTYRPEVASVRTWLFAIARNVVVDAYRSRSRRPLPQEPDPSGPAAVADDQSGTSLDRMVVTEALARLSEEHREVVLEIRINQLTYQELSDRTRTPVATLRTRMYYALKALREIMKEAGEGHG